MRNTANKQRLENGDCLEVSGMVMDVTVIKLGILLICEVETIGGKVKNTRKDKKRMQLICPVNITIILALCILLLFSIFAKTQKRSKKR